MASRHPALRTHEEHQPDAALSEAIRSRARGATELLPGAVVLLGYHVLTVRSGGPGHLQALQQVIFGVSLASVIISVVLLALLAGVRASLSRETRRERQLLQANVLATAGLGTLSAGLAGDLFVAAATLTGSPDVGALAGAVLLVLIYVPWP
jgi:hypothetical protein